MTEKPVPRRKFLGGVAATGLLVSAPLWIQTAFAGDSQCARSLRALVSLGSAFRRANQTGKRLLVLVIPEALDQKYDRGRLFGAWLNCGSDADLAPLSLCELACSTMGDLRNLVPNAPGGEPLLVLVDPSKLGRPAVAIDPTVPALEKHAWPSSNDWEKSMRALMDLENAEWEARTTVLSRAVRIAVAPGVSFPEEATAAEQVRSRWVRGRVPGSRWAQNDGCGTTIEGVESDDSIGCGMGYVPEKAKRFLYLLTRAPFGSKEFPP
jgi:hypothetical protein